MDDKVKTDSSLAEIFIEFKMTSGDDPFLNLNNLDSNPARRHVVCDGNGSDETLGQITSYAAAQLGSQFRTHIFSVLIVRDTARLLRWDRSGAIVTESFRYNTCSLLPDFFTRYSNATDAERSKDTSASEPSLTEKYAARIALDLGDTIPLVKLSIPDAGGD
jgi:asparagine synthetase B (glutamine-hydrolysing)